MKANYKFTIVIPTRERCDVLAKALQTATEQDYADLEIIVSDNFSGDHTEELVRSFNDPRIRYFNTGQRLSMSHNWEFGLSKVTDGWVTILGDDDGLLPGCIEQVSDLAKTSDCLAVASQGCLYKWPSLTGTVYGTLDVPSASGVEVRHSAPWLEKLFSGKAHYKHLPMLYTGGFVSIEAVERVRRRFGQFYQSCIPDVYSAIALGSVIERYVYSQDPLTVFGLSKHSTGTSWARRTNGDALQIFGREGNIPFHKDVPLGSDGGYPKSLQALVYESFLQTEELRDGRPFNRHSQQLATIIALAGIEVESTEAWAQDFAYAHGLSFGRIRLQGRIRHSILRAKTYLGRFAERTSTHRVGSPELPLADVHEAVNAVKQIRDELKAKNITASC